MNTLPMWLTKNVRPAYVRISSPIRLIRISAGAAHFVQEPAPQMPSKGKVKEVHYINPDKCLKCGACMEKCRFGAIYKD